VAATANGLGEVSAGTFQKKLPQKRRTGLLFAGSRNMAKLPLSWELVNEPNAYAGRESPVNW
jgi:hypothetical protein